MGILSHEQTQDGLQANLLSEHGRDGASIRRPDSLDWKEKAVRVFHITEFSSTAGEGYMWRRLVLHSDEMAVALFVWVCTLPLIALLILPRYGLGFASLAAAIVLFIFMIVCWGMCGRELVKG